MIGQRFTRLVVLSESRRWGVRAWLCECDCGVVVTATTSALRRGANKSCGCLGRTHAITHGGRGTPEHTAWQNMTARCRNHNHPGYPNYGGRGITVCDRWRHDFAAFLADMGPRPSPKHSIDRINNNGNYEPGNCRWATQKEQTRNMRTTIVLRLGDAVVIARDVADKIGLSSSGLRKRRVNGWTDEEIAATPVMTQYRRPQKKGPCRNVLLGTEARA